MLGHHSGKFLFDQPYLTSCLVPFSHLLTSCIGSESRYSLGSETPMHPSRTPLYPIQTPMREPGGVLTYILCYGSI